MFGLRASHIIYMLEQNWPTGGDTSVNRMGIRGVLNEPVDRRPPGIYLFVDKFLLQELILSRTEGVRFI